MTGAELLRSFRVDADDVVEPRRWADPAVLAWLNEAEAEAALRARLIHESADAEVCQIAVTAGTAVYPLHPALYEIDYLAFLPDGGRRREPVRIQSPEVLDRICPDWRERAGHRVHWAVQDDKTIRLVPAPEADGTLFLEGYRLPLKPFTAGTSPEINAAHHRFLVHWALHRAFSVPDTEVFDPARAANALAAFEQYFGLRPDAGLRRSTREDESHHTEAFWV